MTESEERELRLSESVEKERGEVELFFNGQRQLKLPILATKSIHVDFCTRPRQERGFIGLTPPHIFLAPPFSLANKKFYILVLSLTYSLYVCVRQKVGNLCGGAVDLHKCRALHLLRLWLCLWGSCRHLVLFIQWANGTTNLRY